MSALARELRIGNLLYSGSKIPYEVTAEDIGYIDDNSNSTPIPITREWLLNAGFEKRIIESDFFTKYQYLKDDVYVQIEQWLKDGSFDSSFAFYSNFNHINQIKYIHQLQNIYFEIKRQELQFKEISEFKSPVLTN